MALTDDDRALLDCVRDGLTVDLTARRLGISPTATAMRLLRLRQRHGAATTAQLVGVLYDRGLLEPRVLEEAS